MWDGKVGSCEGDGCEDATDPKEVTPAQELTNDSCNDDSAEKSEHGRSAVNRKDKVLPRSRPVDGAHKHDACRQGGSRSKPLKSPADVQHHWIDAEARDDAPYYQPSQTSHEDRVSSDHVTKTSEHQESAGNDERKCGRWPYARCLWNAQLSYEGRQEDSESRDEKVRKELRHGDAENEADLAPSAVEDRWTFAAQSLDAGL